MKTINIDFVVALGGNIKTLDIYLIGRYGINVCEVYRDRKNEYLVILIPDEKDEGAFLDKLSGKRDIMEEIKHIFQL